MTNPTTPKPYNLSVASLGGSIKSAVGGAHQAAHAMDRVFHLRAGCFSRKDSVNAESAKVYGVSPEHTYKSLEDMLAKEAGKLDAVVILTPTDQHGKQVLACIEAGIPVVCEKALSASYDEIIKIKEALNRKQGYLAVAYNYPGYPLLRELAHRIKQGQLGKIQQVHIEMPQEGFLKLKPDGTPLIPQEWRTRDGEVPTVSLDLGDHLQIITHFLTGETPLEVVSKCNNFGNIKQITDNVICMAQYTNDMIANIWYGKVALGQRNGLRVRVFGSKGSAEWFQENPEYLHMADQQGRRYTLDRGHPDVTICNQPRYTRFKAGHPAGYIEAFANTYYDIADHLVAWKEKRAFNSGYIYGVDEALKGFELFQAISKSAATKQWVKVG